MDLIEFLRARLDEDEAAIREDAGLGLAYGWPARLLAEVEAKRQVVALHESVLAFLCSSCEDEPYPCPTLLALARVYAEHPAFDRAWLVSA